MNKGIIGTLIKKDLTLLFRNWLLSIPSLVFIVVIIVLYFIMPAKVNEELKLAVYGSPLPQAMIDELAGEGVELTYMESEEKLNQGVESGDFIMGIVFPEDLLLRISSGERPEVKVVFGPSVPPAMKKAEVKFIEQIVFLLQGEPLNIHAEEELILGPDMTGRQIPTRDRLIPIYAIFIILMEIMGLAILIVEEHERGTLRALLVASVKMESLLTAKAITAIGLAFLQAVFLLAVTGTLTANPLLLLTGLFLGSFLVAGLGFLVAAFSRDMMTVIAWSILVMLVLFLPAFNILLPGLMSGWVRIIPSHYLTDLMHRVAHFDAEWTQMWKNLAILVLGDLGLLALGSLVLRRKLA